MEFRVGDEVEVEANNGHGCDPGNYIITSLEKKCNYSCGCKTRIYLEDDGVVGDSHCKLIKRAAQEFKIGDKVKLSEKGKARWGHQEKGIGEIKEGRSEDWWVRWCEDESATEYRYSNEYLTLISRPEEEREVWESEEMEFPGTPFKKFTKIKVDFVGSKPKYKMKGVFKKMAIRETLLDVFTVGQAKDIAKYLHAINVMGSDADMLKDAREVIELKALKETILSKLEEAKKEAKRK
jgi:hypothetical protein